MKGELGVAAACMFYVLQPRRFVVFKRTLAFGCNKADRCANKTAAEGGIVSVANAVARCLWALPEFYSWCIRKVAYLFCLPTFVFAWRKSCFNSTRGTFNVS